MGGQTAFKGKESGLMLLIDANSERSIDISTEDMDKKGKDLASIHIGTLAKSTRYGPGDYGLLSIKQMTVTENFLAWPEHKRLCSLEKYEKCQMKGFLEASSKCGCSSFQLLAAAEATDQVI